MLDAIDLERGLWLSHSQTEWVTYKGYGKAAPNWLEEMIGATTSGANIGIDKLYMEIFLDKHYKMTV